MINEIVLEKMNNFCAVNVILRLNFVKSSFTRYNPIRGVYRNLSRGVLKTFFFPEGGSAHIGTETSIEIIDFTNPGGGADPT